MRSKDAFGFLSALRASTPLTQAVGLDWSLIFVTVADSELLYCQADELYTTKIDAWTLHFRRPTQDCLSLTLHQTHGVKRIEVSSDMPEKDPLPLDQLIFDDIAVQHTLLQKGFRIGRQDCWWSLSMLPVEGVKRPLWVTPFMDDQSGGVVFADAESGRLWVGTSIDQYSQLSTTVSNAIEFVPPGRVQAVVRNKSQGLVSLSEVMKHFPPKVQRDVIEAYNKIQADVIRMYSK